MNEDLTEVTEAQLPSNMKALWLKSQSAYEMKNFTYAISLCHAVLKDSPGFLDARKLARNSAASDMVDHKTLLRRLSDRCGIQGEALKWFRSYLTGRFQMVKIKDATSKKVPLSCGVPQGSVLGPLLFTVYTLPLGDLVRRHGIEYHLYADDTQLYMSFSPSPECASVCLKQIEDCIKDIQLWMLENKLKLNGDKTEMLLIGTPQQCSKISNPCISINGSVISPSMKARNLGVIFDKNMNLKSHVNAVCRSARYYLHNINLVRRYLTPDAAAKAIQAFVVSRLDCTNSLLYGLPACELKKLQKVQNSAARILTGVARDAHMTPVLAKLHWLPIVCRIEYKILMLTYKCMNDLAPQYLADSLKKKNHARFTRAANDTSLLSETSTKLVTAGDRAFSHAAPLLWNRLPCAIRSCENLAKFKCAIKTFLYKRYFN